MSATMSGAKRGLQMPNLQRVSNYAETGNSGQQATPDPGPSPDSEAAIEHPQDELTELAEVTAAVTALTEQLRKHDARAAARERVIDRLHAEVERLRAGDQVTLLRPVVIDLQRLRTQLLHQAHTLPKHIDVEDVLRLLESFAFSAELALERCGNSSVEPTVGEPFSPREHRAAGIVPVASHEADGTIVEVLAEGYRNVQTGRVTAPALVRVGRWIPLPQGRPSPPAEQAGQQEEESPDA